MKRLLETLFDLCQDDDDRVKIESNEEGDEDGFEGEEEEIDPT